MQTSSTGTASQARLFRPNVPMPLQTEVVREHDNYLLSTVLIKPHVILPNEERSIVLSYYRPKGFRRKYPAIILLPITNGDEVTENLARYFVSRGFVVLRYPSRNELGTLKNEQNALLRFSQILRDDVMNVRRGLRWLKLQSEVDAERIGIMGISLGAILSSLVIELEPDINAAVLFLGGGNLSGIFQTSKERPIVRFRKRQFALTRAKKSSNSKSGAGLIQRLNSILDPVDPLSYPSLLTPERILMVNAYFDAVIERRYTRELWHHLGKPYLIFLPTGHYASILFYHYARFKALQHFERILTAQ